MDLKTSPSEMQYLSNAIVDIVESRFNVKCLAYLDDFLFLSKQKESLFGIAEFLTGVGLCINFDKSVLVPTTVITFLGVSVDLERNCARVGPGVVPLLSGALSRCFPNMDKGGHLGIFEWFGWTGQFKWT